jgi:integrase
MPATPETVGAYLAAAGQGYAMPTLRRRVAAIARACGVAGNPLDTRHPAIRETLRGIGRKHGTPARRAAALTTTEIRKLCRVCGRRPGSRPVLARLCRSNASLAASLTRGRRYCRGR